MKKIVLAFCAFLFIFFASCDDFSEVEYEYDIDGVQFTIKGEPDTFFAYYDTFEKNKAAWIEPESYSFVYSWRWGDSFVSSPVKVTVSSENAVFEVEGSYANDMSEEEIQKEENRILKEYEDYGAKFSSIQEIYDYMESYYKDVKEKTNGTNDFSLFVAKYQKAESGLVYPSLFSEMQDEHTDTKSDSCGYGGAHLSVEIL